MRDESRRRGRPEGTGLNDLPYLERMAELMVANPALRPTPAIRRVVHKANEADIRRLQRKWKIIGPDLIAAVRAKAQAIASKRHPANASITISALAQGTAFRQSAAFQAIREFQNSPTMQAIRELQNGPVMRLVRELEASPTMRILRELEGSSLMRTIREQQNG